MKQKNKILVCPLDWGLGHATRSIPIIRELLARECEVCIASSGSALALLKIEFPKQTFYELTGYRPYYSGSTALIPSMMMQVQKFARVIDLEHDETDAIVRRDGISMVISDNRFGCWSTVVPSVIITHQVRILLPWWLSWIVNAKNRSYIRNFTDCWIPDWPGNDALCGEMVAHPPFHVEYVGPLSRFQKLDGVQKKYEILAVISGPEPQRSIFEAMVRRELKKIDKRAMIVRGLPEMTERRINGNLEEVSHLDTAELNQAILESEIIVSRSGYSTVMDLAKLEKRSIFVPTPGQTEQEYLGRKLMKKKIAYSVKQSEFDLQKALIESKDYRGFVDRDSNYLLQSTLDKLLGENGME